MRYWFAGFPDQPERLPYDATQHAADRKYLADLAGDTATAGEEDFPLTDDVKRCRFCPYRSLCGRGIEAGSLGEDERVEPEWRRTGRRGLTSSRWGKSRFKAKFTTKTPRHQDGR